MNKRWKRSVVLALASLGVLSTGELFNATFVNTATHSPHITTNQPLSTDPAKRNVTFTGTEALYSKPKIRSGAKVVVTRLALKELAKSDSSADNFVATREAIASNGQIYYKLNSFNGQYHGWIYGGKKAGHFGGGITPFTTFTKMALPGALSKYTFNIAAPGLNNDGKSVTYQAPMNTVYGSGRTMGDAIDYKDTAFRIDQMGTRTREGDTWVHVTSTDPAQSKADGWIMYKGLSQAESKVPANALRIDLVNSSGQLIANLDYTKDGGQTGQTIGSDYNLNGTEYWLLGANDQQKIQDAVRNALIGTGYQLDALTANQTGYLAEATIGKKTSLTVTKQDPIATNAVRINIENENNAVIASFDYPKDGGQPGQMLGTTDNGTASIADGDKAAIQSGITTALKSSGYKFTDLTADQLTQLADAKLGGSVYLKTTARTDTIANNAVRINFVDPSTKKTVATIDYTNTDTDDPAPKGSNLGVQSGDSWSLKADDKTAITGQANAALAGSGYALTNNQLTDANQATLGAAKFGSSVSVDVTANQNQPSK